MITILCEIRFLSVDLFIDSHPMELFTHDYYMKKALEEARMAFAEDEIPVGAIVVFDNKIIGKGHNQVEKLNDTTAHAEMIAITAASAALNSKF